MPAQAFCPASVFEAGPSMYRERCPSFASMTESEDLNCVAGRDADTESVYSNADMPADELFADISSELADDDLDVTAELARPRQNSLDIVLSRWKEQEPPQVEQPPAVQENVMPAPPKARVKPPRLPLRVSLPLPPVNYNVDFDGEAIELGLYPNDLESGTAGVNSNVLSARDGTAVNVIATNGSRPPPSMLGKLKSWFVWLFGS